MKLSFNRILVNTPNNIKIDRPIEEKRSNGVKNIPINNPRPPRISKHPTRIVNFSNRNLTNSFFIFSEKNKETPYAIKDKPEKITK